MSAKLSTQAKLSDDKQNYREEEDSRGIIGLLCVEHWVYLNFILWVK